MQTLDKPFEADRNFVEHPAQLCRDAIDHRAAHDCFSDRCLRVPSRATLKELMYSYGQKVIGLKKSGTPRDNSVPVVVGVTGEREIETVFHSDQSRHRIGRGRIHSDLTVPIHRHKAERGINRFVYHRQVQAVALRDPRPIVDAGTTERIDPKAELGITNDANVNYRIEIVDVRI